MFGGLTLLSLQVIGAAGQVVVPADVTASAPAPARQVSDDELILYAIALDGLVLTDTLTAYGAQADPLVPVGELARLLDLNISISPVEGRISGQIGESNRALIVDLPQGLARLGGSDIALTAEDVAVSPVDIFIRASALGRLLPLTVEVDPQALSIKLTATEKLPIQARMDRLAKLRGLDRDVGSLAPALVIESPYRLFTPPAFDVALETGTDTRAPRFPRRYDVRAAGDLLYASYTGYLGSDEKGRPSSARLLFERRSPDGNLLGPLGATYASAGDTYTPALPLGPRSVGGRGFTFSTAPLEQASVFQTVDLRGELPIGYDVELYINDVLRSGQRAPVDGRYEFLDVPLVRGTNVIRVVIYGPRGERNEQTRVINVGGGQLAKGEATFDFGIVQQEKTVFHFDRGDFLTLLTPLHGEIRAVAHAAYGVSSRWTVIGGAALYPTLADDRRQLISIGARGSLFGMAIQADAAGDQRGGMAGSIGFAGQPLGVSVVGRHSEYRGDFIDETNRVVDLGRPLSRHSELTLDMSLPSIAGKVVPLSLRLERDEFARGGSTWAALARASVTVADTLLATGFDYQRDNDAEGIVHERLAGSLAASRFIDFKWQVRGVLDYDLLPEAQLRALGLTAARDISQSVGFRFGAGRSFGNGSDFHLQGGAFFRLPFADIALTGDYATAKNDWRVGIRLAFGLAFDPGGAGYQFTRPGPAAGGSAIFHAFHDSNANDRFDPGEEPVPNVAVEGGERKAVTGEDGRAFITGLGASVSGQLRASIDKIDAFYVSAPPSNINFSPRPGQVMAIAYPLAPVAEVLARVTLRKGDEVTGLSAVRLRLVKDGAEPIEGTTEFDGTVIFTGVRPGSYRLELDPEQAERLNMRLASSVTVNVDGEGFANEVAAEVLFATSED